MNKKNEKIADVILDGIDPKIATNPFIRTTAVGLARLNSMVVRLPPIWRIVARRENMFIKKLESLTLEEEAVIRKRLRLIRDNAVCRMKNWANEPLHPEETQSIANAQGYCSKVITTMNDHLVAADKSLFFQEEFWKDNHSSINRLKRMRAVYESIKKEAKDIIELLSRMRNECKKEEKNEHGQS
jgi:hypothetical protein